LTRSEFQVISSLCQTAFVVWLRSSLISSSWLWNWRSWTGRVPVKLLFQFHFISFDSQFWASSFKHYFRHRL